MNNKRRQKVLRCVSQMRFVQMSLEAMIEHIDALSNLKKDIDRLSVDINSTMENLAKVHDEEQEAYYSFPENLQTSEIAMNMWGAISDIEDSQGDVAKLLDRVDELEEVYYQFLKNYNPYDLKTKIESITDEVEDVKGSIEYITTN